jgi:hypothetical protein
MIAREIDIEEVRIDGELVHKLRIKGTLYGVFGSRYEAEEYLDTLKNNDPGDLSVASHEISFDDTE